MSGCITCDLNREAVSVLRHALEKDLNGRGWLKRGFVFFVQEISEPELDLLIENTDTVDIHDAFPVRLQVAWEDLNAHSIKEQLVSAVGPTKAFGALAEDQAARFRERGRGSALSFGLTNRLVGRV